MPGSDDSACRRQTVDGGQPVKSLRKNNLYTSEDAAAEREFGNEFAVAWGLAYRHVGDESHYDGLLHSVEEGAVMRVKFIFELKNRNVSCDGKNVIANNKTYPTLPLSKAKVENLYAEAVRRNVPALLVFRAKQGGGMWWVDIARCLNLKVFKDSGRTKSPMRPSDIEDCVYIPISWFTASEEPYVRGDNHRFGVSYAKVFATQGDGEFK